jgi:hypothetical protein
MYRIFHSTFHINSIQLFILKNTMNQFTDNLKKWCIVAKQFAKNVAVITLSLFILQMTRYIEWWVQCIWKWNLHSFTQCLKRICECCQSFFFTSLHFTSFQISLFLLIYSLYWCVGAKALYFCAKGLVFKTGWLQCQLCHMPSISPTSKQY